MADPGVTTLVQHLVASGFADVSGARVSATIPIAESFLNQAIALALPPAGAVRVLTVHPAPDNRLTLRVKMARPEFLPALDLKLQIAQQPDLPASPVLGFRVLTLPGLMSAAGVALSFTHGLPPGVQLKGDRLSVDLRPLLEAKGLGMLLVFAERLQLATEAGRLVVDLALRV